MDGIKKKLFPDLDPGVKKTPNPDPQHCFHAYYIVFFTSALFCCGLLNSNQAQKSPGCETPVLRIRDPGWRQFGSGIRDGKKSNPGSATLWDTLSKNSKPY
jgi:hypothetical protein